MKRITYVFVALALMLAFLPTTVFAHTEGDPHVVDLIAGQYMDVGDVKVWNDATNLYMEFVLDGDWCLKETHVAVGEIPMTKKGNPIPGQFPYSEEFELAACEQNPDPYIIPLEWGNGEDVMIAAHAAVARPVDSCYEQVWQIGYVEVTNATTGWLENYADEFNWEYPADPVTAGPSLADSQPAFTTPFVVGTTPVNEFPYNSNYNRGYATDFDVQWDGGLPFGGRLTVSWSPGQSAAEKKVISNDGGLNAVFTATGTSQPGQGWFLDTYPLVENSADVAPLSAGTHTINFKHTQGDGTFWDWIRLEKPCEQWETAWGAGTRFVDKGNWATYFTYTIQPAIVVEGDVYLDVVSRNGTPYTDTCTRHAIFEVYNNATGTLDWYQTCGGNSWEHHIAVDTLTITDDIAEFSGIATASTGGQQGNTLYVKVQDDAPDIYWNWWDPTDVWEYSVVSGDIVVVH